MNYSRAELLDPLAGQYVLGTLRGRARRRFERVLAGSSPVQSAVRDWQGRLAPLAQSVTPVDPPARVWHAIEARTATTRAQRSGWRAWWPALGGFAVGATLLFVSLIAAPERFVTMEGLAQREQSLPQSYVGFLANAEGEPVALASSTRRGTRMTVKFIRPVPVPAGKMLQLWAMPREAAPFPLGRFGSAPPPGKVVFELADTSERLLSSVPRLLISIEDAAVPPPPSPSAAVLSGPCVKLW